jgi:nitrogen-specific signal transduction histidine kinase
MIAVDVVKVPGTHVVSCPKTQAKKSGVVQTTQFAKHKSLARSVPIAGIKGATQTSEDEVVKYDWQGVEKDCERTKDFCKQAMRKKDLRNRMLTKQRLEERFKKLNSNLY